MVIYGSEAPRIEAEWMDEKKDVSEGAYLLDFWSYTCQDCSERVNELSKLHESTDLEVIGVHAPEFGFEHEEDNLKNKLEEQEISYPVVVDDDKSTWKSFGNRERPRQVIVKDGKVAWKNAGDSKSVEEALKDVLGLEETPELDLQRQHSPMMKLGYSNCNGINEQGNFKGEKSLEMPSTRKMNHVYLSGSWKQEEDCLEAVENAVLRIKFRASEVSAVIEPEGSSTLEVEVDSGKPEGKAGEDVENAKLKAENPDVYSIIQSKQQVQSELTLRVASGTKIYAVSFR